MGSIYPVLLLALAGILSGGAFSLHRQGSGKVTVGLIGVLAVVAGLGGVLWLIPET